MRFVRTIVLIAICALSPLAALADTTGGVRGFVRFLRSDPTSPIQNAQVTVHGPNGVFQTYTDSHGFYVIFGIPPGRYRISAWKDLYTTRPLLSGYPMCVHAGENRYADLFLDRALIDFVPWARHEYLLQFRPDASQTADVYSVGDC